MTTLKELFEKRAELIAESRSEPFDKDPGEWNGDDQERWQRINAGIDDFTAQIEDAESRQEIAQQKATIEEIESRKSFARTTEFGEFKADKHRTAITKEHRALAFQGWLFNRLERSDKLTKEHEQAFHLFGSDFRQKDLHVNMGTGLNRGFNVWSTKRGAGMDWTHFDETVGDYLQEYRGPLDTGTANAGAEWIPAEDFRAELIRFMIAFGPIRGVVRTITTSSGEPMRMPSGDDTGNAAAIKAEKAASDFADPVTDDRTWGAYKYNSGVKWSWEMAQDSPLNLQSILAEYLGERMGRAQSAHFTTGTGTGQPEGITVGASDSGATWSLGTPAGNGDSLIEAQVSLDPAYEASGSVGWMFNKTTLGEIRKLKDGENRYHWQPGLRAGEPDLLLGDMYVVNQDMPAPSGTNRAILYGDMSSYIIRDAGAMRLRVLNELYAETDEIGMIAWYRSDGKCKRISAAITADPSIKYIAVAP